MAPTSVKTRAKKQNLDQEKKKETAYQKLTALKERTVKAGADPIRVRTIEECAKLVKD